MAAHQALPSLGFSRQCDPMDCSPPGSSVHGIFQARVLESGAIAFSVKKSGRKKKKKKSGRQRMFQSKEIKGLEVDLTALFHELKYQRSWIGDHESVHKAPRRSAHVGRGKGPRLCPEGTGEPGNLSREGIWA